MKHTIPVLFSLFFTLYACNDYSLDDCNYISEVPIHSVSMPDSIAKDSTAQINITYQIPNNCSKLLSVEHFNNADTFSIHVICEFTTCNCQEIEQDSTTQIEFYANDTVTYYFRFLHTNNKILEDSIHVYN